MIDLTLAIPTFNSMAHLEELLASLCRQPVRPQAILFSDNASTDGTVARLERFRIENPDLYVRINVNTSDLGIAGNYNRLIDRAFDTEWLHILDSDDYLLGDFYARLAPALTGGPGREPDLVITSMRTSSGAVSAYAAAFERAMRAARARTVPSFLQILGSAACRSALVYRTSKLKTRKFLDPQFDGSDIIHAAPFLDHHLYWPDARVYYRIHPASETSRIERSRARARRDHASYLKYVASLPLATRLSFQADFILRKKIAVLIRRPWL